ncbi:hypothetical protein B0A77_02930 [Flavobacterium branchiophilum]|uniref:Uncharacterized protein n=1 Tax=Flavobacterium branchiophilum TaxID=55197 RepID=A0A2H3KDZ1_9FLAO|nr:hypothetical protein [Flavobacterium branchiophilum]PDS26279.1 hypothetical protein B0A77_02930 [Flavobacterium branchiophilum]
MFSTGQLIFASLFFVSFVLITMYSYKKDKNLHSFFYKGNYKVLLAFLIFIGLLFVIKFYFKH